MLMYNGRPLPVGVKMIGYTLWSPAMELRTIDIPTQRGVLRTGSKIGARSVRFDFVIEAENTWQATVIAQELRKWCMSEGAGKLKIPRLPGVYLEAECETFPAPQMDKPWEPFEASFYCFRPEFISEQELTANVPGPLQIGGTVSTPVLLEFASPSQLVNPVWTIDAHTIALNGTISPGLIEIDTSEDRAKVTVDGEDLTGLVTLESDLAIMLDPGAHTVTGPAGLSGSCRWRNRFI